MADNTITLEFQPCQQAPANGYRVTYRPAGSEMPLRTWPVNFTSSPAIFTDTLDAPGTQYEGFVQGDCGDAEFGVQVPWSTSSSESDSASGGSDDTVPVLVQVDFTFETSDLSISAITFNDVPVLRQSGSYPITKADGQIFVDMPVGTGTVKVTVIGTPPGCVVLTSTPNFHSRGIAAPGVYTFTGITWAPSQIQRIISMGSQSICADFDL